uniref:Olfactory receptor 7E24-like n=1 Tax=Castor canadensis TaxID=51338 RepID=A0A8B7U9N0_CASCN|nr:olfactory receptor 7E24-like [Castor canadensis]
MKSQNLTGVMEFQLVGLSDDSELQLLFFGLFLIIYVVTVLGNLLIILAVSSASHHQTSMYFFLSNLSLADIGFSNTTIPKMLVNIQTHSKSITYVGCFTQVSFFFLFGCLDSLLLSVMAICQPLHYPIIMSPCMCGLLILISFSISVLDSLVHCLMVSQLTFCIDIVIRNFFCDPPQLLKISCDYISTYNILIYVIGAIFGGVPVSGIHYSYIRIISSIVRVPLISGKYKAFPTCGSHLLLVSVFYGTAFGAYFSSIVSHNPGKVMVASVMYTMVTPMLNPFVYSLRNRDLKKALWRVFSKTFIC